MIWPTVQIGETVLTFKCTYRTLLILETETKGEWQQALKDAIGMQSPKAVVDMAVRMTGDTHAHISDLSPPMNEVTNAISLAFDVCMRGPIALREAEDAKDKAEGDTDEPGKTLPKSSEADLAQPSAQASQSETSGS